MQDATFSMLFNTCVKMVIAAAISGTAMIVGSYVCADLTSKIGTDMRNALSFLPYDGTDSHPYSAACA